MNIYISPHPDDAILSCGGRMLSESKKKQLVINVFSKLYDRPTEWDKTCRNLEKPMVKRINEDKKILSKIRIESIYLSFYDDAVYNDLKDKSRPKDKRQLIAKNIKEKINSYPGEKNLFFPKGFGHTDHRIVSKIGEELSQDFNVYFYEDLPYSIGRDSDCKYCYEINKNILDRKINLICAYKTQIYGFLELTNTRSVSDFKKKMRNYHLKNSKICENYD